MKTQPLFSAAPARLTAACLLAMILFSCSQNPQERPHILLVMADDLGFSDPGCYGGEIRTPVIDELAAGGLRFSHFYNTAKCHSSRVSLLTGLYCNQAGNRGLGRAVTIAQVLAAAGYTTSMTGKWHLEGEPTDFGFGQYWGHLSGMTDYFLGDSTFRFNRRSWNDFGADFYTTDANADFSLRFLEEALDGDRPFFHYIAFNAPHYPLQAPREDVAACQGMYGQGWDAVREARFEKQKNLGLFAAGDTLPPLPTHVPRWDSLTERRKQFEQFRMATYAAMVERMDRNLGRIIDYLADRGELDNTLIMFCSDNGACPFERSRDLQIPPWEGGSFLLYDASWATVSNTPLLHYKQTQHEGGISTPLIIHWPRRIGSPGRWESDPGHLVDIMATCIDAAGATYPDTGDVEPLQGRSLLPLMRGEKRDPHEELYFVFQDCRALRQGRWKLVSFYGQAWELYDLKADRFEQHNLAESHPGRVRDMAARWHELAESTDRLPPSLRQPVTAGPVIYRHPEWHRPEQTAGWKPFTMQSTE